MRTAALLIFAGWSVSIASAADPVAPAPIVLQPGQTIVVVQQAAGPKVAAPCTTCGDKAAEAKKPGVLHRLFKKVACSDGKCGEKGCNNPLGCGNLYTECKFIFGGCRDFFGTDAASAGHLHNTVTP